MICLRSRLYQKTKFKQFLSLTLI